MEVVKIEGDVVTLRVHRLAGVARALEHPENLEVEIRGSQLAGLFWKPGDVYSGKVLHGAGVGAI